MEASVGNMKITIKLNGAEAMSMGLKLIESARCKPIKFSKLTEDGVLVEFVTVRSQRLSTMAKRSYEPL